MPLITNKQKKKKPWSRRKGEKEWNRAKVWEEVVGCFYGWWKTHIRREEAEQKQPQWHWWKLERQTQKKPDNQLNAVIQFTSKTSPIGPGVDSVPTAWKTSFCPDSQASSPCHSTEGRWAMREDAGKMSPIFCGTCHTPPALSGLHTSWSKALAVLCVKASMPAETIVSEVLCNPLRPSKEAGSEMKEIPSQVLRFGKAVPLYCHKKILPGDSEEQCRHNYGCAFKVLRAPEFPSGKERSPWYEEELSDSFSGNSGLGDQKNKTFV